MSTTAPGDGTRLYEHLSGLRRAYDLDAWRRDGRVPEAWRCDVVDRFASRVRTAVGTGARVLDIGCGTGQLARRVADAGLTVVGIDLSARNVERTTARGVGAVVADVGRAPFRAGAFHAAFAVNSLLHVPRVELGATFATIARLLAPRGLLTVVVWGGVTREGPLPDDWLDPPRFFSTLADDDLLRLPTPGFRRLETRLLHEHASGELHPQVLTLVRG